MEWVYDEDVQRCTSRCRECGFGETDRWLRSNTQISRMDVPYLRNSMQWMIKRATQMRSDHLLCQPDCGCGVGLTDEQWLVRTPLYGALGLEISLRDAIESVGSGRGRRSPQVKSSAKVRSSARSPWSNTNYTVCRTFMAAQPPHQYGPGKVHYLAVPDDDPTSLRIACVGRFISPGDCIDFDTDAITCLNCAKLPVAMRTGGRPNAHWEDDCAHEGKISSYRKGS